MPAAPGSFSTIVTGADGNLWWADGAAHIYRTELNGATITFTTPSSGVHVLAPGPDGNIWYVNRVGGANVVGRVTPAGVITQFAVPGAFPLRTLTAGPDGNIWVLFEGTDFAPTPLLAKVTTAGVVTTYVIDSESLATSIVAGPAGRIWWLDRNFPAIKSVDPANPTTSLQTYTPPPQFSAASSPTNLQVGADGNIWAASGLSGRSYLWRLTPSGDTTVFNVQTDSSTSGINGLVAAPDGNIWFAASNPRQLYRLNPNGTQTNFSSVGCRCDPLAAGPDGRIWTFDSASTNLIGVSLGDTSTTVLNLASGFSSPDVKLPSFGSKLRFVFTGPTNATATDSSGLGLFDSGTRALGSHFDYTFPAAGTYPYQDSLQPSRSGTVEVPPTSDRRYSWGAGVGGGGLYDIRWADDASPAGYVYDVQRQNPGQAFADYLIGTTRSSSLEQPVSPPGMYQYRARLRRISDNVATGYSPPVAVRYANENAAFLDGYSTQRSVYRPSNGTWSFMSSAPGSTNTGGTTYGGSAGDVPVPGDYDGDGVADVAIFRPSSGLWAIHKTSGGADPFVTYGGIPGDVPIPADYDGDGKTDVAIFRPAFATWWVHLSSNNTDVATTFGIPGDLPVPGADFDGDGKADLAVFRNGIWFVQQSSDSSLVTTAYGQSGDVPVPGYYDGDAKSDIGVYRPSSGSWFKHPSTDQDTAVVWGGIAGDVPVPGDYDADGLTDVAIFRPASGTWYVRYTNSGKSDGVQQWGASGDIPLPLPTAVRLAFYP